MCTRLSKFALTVFSVPKCDERVQHIKDDARLHQGVVVQLSEVFYTAHASLIQFGDVYLQTDV